MKRNIRIQFFLMGLLLPLLSMGQEGNLTGREVQIVINPGTIVTVPGNITVEEGFAFTSQGVIALGGDWANRSTQPVFPGFAGLVNLTGTDQFIGGSSDTRFGWLAFTGAGLKTLERSVLVSDSLHLHDAVLETLDNTIHLTNTNPEALQWDGGYVQSNTLGGALSRSVKNQAAYLFPVGSDQLARNYRGVQIVPNQIDSAVFKVRLAGLDASFDQGTSPAGNQGPFDLSFFSQGEGRFNNRFYHNIYQAFGSGGADVDIFFFNSDNLSDQYNNIYEWNAQTSQWEPANFEVRNAPILSGFDSPDWVARSNIADFNSDSFVLGFEEESFLVPQIFTPGGDGLNDFLEIASLNNFPNNSLKVFDRWGDKIFEAAPYNNDWQGTFKGADLPNGTYFYILDLGTSTNLGGRSKVNRGFFQILRN